MSCQNRTKGLYETVPAATPDNHKGTRPLDKCFILGIPDDILVEILRVASHVTPDRKTPGHELYETAARLALVCRRFNRIATPLLYWQININCQVDSITNWSLLTAAAAKKLHRSLRRQPNLWSYCRRLTIHAAGAEHAEPGSNISYIANDFVTWLTAARYLSISYLSPRNEGAWSLVRTALEHMTNLVALDLQCDGDENIDIGEVVEAFGDRQHPYLRTLELTGIGKESISNVAWTKLKDSAGTMPFTKLRIYGFLHCWDVLEALARWPAKLEEFGFQFGYRLDYGGGGLFTGWSLATLLPIFAIHKQTLRSIVVTNICRPGLAGLDLSEFESLEYLRLSDATTGCDPALVGNIIDAPRLRTFHWDFTLEDQQHGTGLDAFGQREEDWLRALVDAAVERRSSLRKIMVEFKPDDGIYRMGTENMDDVLYPWDRLDAVGLQASSESIDLWYPDPTMSREEFERGIARIRGLTPDILIDL